MRTPNRNRQSIRLRGYDYTREGLYFVTICTHLRLHLFGEITDGVMQFNVWGNMVHRAWITTQQIRPNVTIDAFVVMPNHTHAIIHIDDTTTVGAQCIAPLPQKPTDSPKRGVTPNNVVPNSLGAIVRGFKGDVTRTIRRLPNPPDGPIWQRNYHEHIIRNERSYHTIRQYVLTNPQQWQQDSLYSQS
jgi:putative transposase